MKIAVSFLAVFLGCTGLDATEYRVKWEVVTKSTAPEVDQYGQQYIPSFPIDKTVQMDRVFDNGIRAAWFLESMSRRCETCQVLSLEALCPECEKCMEHEIYPFRTQNGQEIYLKKKNKNYQGVPGGSK